MLKNKRTIILLIIILMILAIPSFVNGAVDYTKTIQSNDGTIKLHFTGLTLDESKSYEFALTRQGDTPTDWFRIEDGYTSSEADIVLSGANYKIVNVLKTTDTGYIYIREKDITDTYIVEAHKVNLKLPYLKSVTYTKNEFYYDIDNIYGDIGGALSTYYKFEKITDEQLIKQYLDDNKQTDNLEQFLPTPPDAGYDKGANIYTSGQTDGLYILWIKMVGNNCKDVYGAIIHDGIPTATSVGEYLGEKDIPVEGVTLDKNKITLKVGETYKIKATVNPENSTNTNVVFTTSDSSIAKVDDEGLITAVAEGTATITVTTEDGAKTATCEVTVIKKEQENNSGNNNNGNNNNNISANNIITIKDKEDNTTSGKVIPNTGKTLGIICIISVVSILIVACYINIKRYKEIK